ncbi:hypothetical protein EDB89DRAFT_1960675 [Lactarius sanguifluus]|nr:hypothetical protein EDB89DRAFT_1960675 [Lactarius sanguifluus]
MFAWFVTVAAPCGVGEVRGTVTQRRIWTKFPPVLHVDGGLRPGWELLELRKYHGTGHAGHNSILDSGAEGPAFKLCSVQELRISRADSWGETLVGEYCNRPYRFRVQFPQHGSKLGRGCALRQSCALLLFTQPLTLLLLPQNNTSSGCRDTARRHSAAFRGLRF